MGQDSLLITTLLANIVRKSNVQWSFSGILSSLTLVRLARARFFTQKKFYRTVCSYSGILWQLSPVWTLTPKWRHLMQFSSRETSRGPGVSLTLPQKTQKITSSHFALEKNFELDLWASLERILNNYPSSPNGLWVNSPWAWRPNGLLTQRPWAREE